MRFQLSFVSLIFVALVAGGSVGCKSAEAKDMENICNAVERSGARSEKDPAERATKVAKWIDENVKADGVKKELRALSAISSPGKKAEILRVMAKEYGYEGPCPLADGND